jgi:hypothetical protein
VAPGDPLGEAPAPLAVEDEPFNIAAVPASRYRYRFSKIPSPGYC